MFASVRGLASRAASYASGSHASASTSVYPNTLGPEQTSQLGSSLYLATSLTLLGGKLKGSFSFGFAPVSASVTEPG